MKFIAIKARKRNWMNRTARETLGINVNERVYIKFGSRVEGVEVRRAPRSKLAAIKAMGQVINTQVIAINPSEFNALGLVDGAVVEVTVNNPMTAPSTEVRRDRVNVTPQPSAVKQVVNVTPNGGKQTNKEKLAGLKVGQAAEFTSSYLNSARYGDQKSLGIKTERIGPTTLKRVL